MVKVDRTILFYDGDCGFCNEMVKIVLRYECGSKIFFSSLQSPFAAAFFEEKGVEPPDLSTFYFYTDHVLYSRSSAFLMLVPFLKWPFQIFQIIRLIPICQRDAMYRFIAERRKKLRKAYCYVPKEQQQERFLLRGDQL